MVKHKGPVAALGGFVAEAYGERINVTQGDAFEADHPAVKANPHLFGPLTFSHPIKGRVEQATAAPGEKRSLLRRKPKASPKASPKKAEPKAKPEPKAESTPEPEPAPVGKALTTDSFRR